MIHAKPFRFGAIFSKSLLLGFGVVLFSAGCAYKVDKTGGQLGKLTGGPSAAMMQHVSYDDVRGIFQAHCVTCHGNSGGVNLESLQSARAFLARIKLSTIVEKRMPKAPMGDLSADERMLLWAWIDAGGPEQPMDGSNHPKQPIPVLEPKYDSIRSEILEKKCIVCHQVGGKAARVPLLTRSDLLDSPLDIVIPGNAEESGLVMVLGEKARKRMPPPDSGMSPVSAQDLEVIKDWISRGAKD